MTQIFKQKIATMTAVVLIALAATLMLPALTMSGSAQDIQNRVNCGANIELGNNCTPPAGSAGTDGLQKIITTVINVFSAIVGAIAVIMIIVGGFRYITSGGDSNNVGGAKNTIIYAIVGLVIVALAQIIVKFVLEKSTGTS